MGDLVIDLDQNFQVTWTWNAFDHLDPNRGPVLGETCAVYSYACPGSSPNAVDWLHSNSVNSSPADGNLVISMRHQDWVIKVRYQNGFGDGEVLWRLGPEGDFTLVNGSGEFPWNSHQHDAIYVGPNRIALYDNGNTRCRGAASGTCNSRGQIYELDEASGLAIQVLNADLGVYSDRLGSAEILTNGNYFFGSGAVSWDPASGDATEVTPDGAISYTQRVQDQFYRSKRFKSLYTP
jgi:hypothetical protein